MSRCVYKPVMAIACGKPLLECVRCGHRRRTFTPPEKIARECGESHSGPCRHLGEAIGMRECESCQGRVRLKLFACALHGVCTLGKRIDMLACCAQCGDYEAARRDEADDGRNG